MCHFKASGFCTVEEASAWFPEVPQEPCVSVASSGNHPCYHVVFPQAMGLQDSSAMQQLTAVACRLQERGEQHFRNTFYSFAIYLSSLCTIEIN